MNLLYTILSIFLISFSLHSQNEFAKHWHIANSVHLDFNTGNPAVNNNSVMETYESSVSYSDVNGDLLFYSNMGIINNASPSQSTGLIWNRNHEVMPNGGLLDSIGCQSSMNGGIVIPDFSNHNIYYLYTTDCQEAIWYFPSKHVGLRRTTIDMSLDGGLGDIIEKGTAIFGDSITRMGGGIAATRHANGTDYWILTHSLNYPSLSTTFYTFLVTVNGIMGPYPQDIGISHISPYPIEISPNGDKIVYGQELFDFDNATGLLSTSIDLGYNSLGTAFSPNGTLLYATDGFKIYQYNLSSNDIAGSRITIHTAPHTIYESIGDMQLGPNCKIYVVNFDATKLGVINLGNLPGTACHFVPNAINFTNILGPNYFKFPNFIESEFSCQTATIEEVSQKKWTVKQSMLDQQIFIYSDIELIGQELTIVDVNGRIVFRNMLSKTESIVDVSNFGKGIYIVRISNQILGKKIVI